MNRASPIGGAGTRTSNILSFIMDFQTQTNWCWAAVSKSVASFFDSTSNWTQCSVANAALKSKLGAISCCKNPVNRKCNIPWYLGRALAVVGAFVRRVNNAESFSTVKSEISSGRPLCVRVGWSSGGGHFLSIIGWVKTRSGEKFYEVTDPIYGRQTVKVAKFKTSYRGTGRWTHSYYIMTPRAGGEAMKVVSNSLLEDQLSLGA